MKTAIIYATKYGTVSKCANILKEKIEGEVDLFDLKEKAKFRKGTTDFQRYDRIIIGGSIHAGHLQKSVFRFCNKNLPWLNEKKIGLFLCTMTPPDKASHYFADTFPPELVKQAKSLGNFRGELIYEKMNPIERLILKKISGITESRSLLVPENIDQFVREMD